MRKYIASSPNAQIVGRALLALETSILRDEFAELLGNYNLKKIDPDEWYSQQTVLDFHRSIMQQSNGSEREVSIGTKIADEISTQFAPGISLEEAIRIFCSLHTQVQRNISDEDRFLYRRNGECSLEITNSSPYPDDMVYGYAYSLAQRYCPQGTHPVLAYRDIKILNSDLSMIIDLTW